jgi:hypothetical protein
MIYCHDALESSKYFWRVCFCHRLLGLARQKQIARAVKSWAVDRV